MLHHPARTSSFRYRGRGPSRCSLRQPVQAAIRGPGDHAVCRLLELSAAVIMRMWLSTDKARLPLRPHGLAQSKAGRCSGLRCGAPSRVIAPQQKLLAASISARAKPSAADRSKAGSSSAPSAIPEPQWVGAGAPTVLSMAASGNFGRSPILAPTSRLVQEEPFPARRLSDWEGWNTVLRPASAKWRGSADSGRPPGRVRPVCASWV
jgi:hypothetical protein